MNIDRSVEQYRFTCHRCTRTWHTSYEVHSVTDGDGTVWAAYYRDGATAENPAGELIICPGCHHTTVTAHLTGRHDPPDPQPTRRT